MEKPQVVGWWLLQYCWLAYSQWAGLGGGWNPATEIPWEAAASVLAELGEGERVSRYSRDAQLDYDRIGKGPKSSLSCSDLWFFWGNQAPVA